MIIKAAEAPDYECPQEITSEHYSYCRGSRCMAWRWVDTANRNYIDPYGNVSPSIAKEPSTTHGYCGLAGRP